MGKTSFPNSEYCGIIELHTRNILRRITLKITIDLAWSVIDFEERKDLVNLIDQELKYKMGFREDGYMFSPLWKQGIWDGYVSLHERYKLAGKEYIKFPSGLTDEVDTILGELQNNHGFTYSILDDRPDPLLSIEDVPDEIHLTSAESGDITLRDYQMDSVRQIAKHQVGILHLSTNSGKTMTAAGIIKLAYSKLLAGERIAFFTHSSAIFNQVHKELKESLGIRVGKYGSGKKDIQRVTVVMIPTVQAALKTDPEKGVKLSARERITKKIAKDLAPKFLEGVNQRLLLQAYIKNFQEKTKADGDYIREVEEILYTCGSDAQVKFKMNSFIAEYDAIIKKKNQKTFQKYKDAMDFLESVVCAIGDEFHHIKSDSYYNVFMNCSNAIVKVGLTGSIDKDDKMLMRRMKGVAHNVVARVTNDDMIERGVSAKPQIIISPITQVLVNGHAMNIQHDKDYMNAYEMGIVQNEYRNILLSKITEMCYHKGEGVLVIVNRIDHGNKIGELLQQLNIPYEFVTGEQDVDDREVAFDAMKQGELKVLISTSLVDEGVSISGINSLIMAAGGKSLRQVLQRIGRSLRKKKEGENKATIYDTLDATNSYLYLHSKERRKIYEAEGFDIIDL